MQDKNDSSAMKLNQGIHKPASVNDDAANLFLQKKRSSLSVSDYVKGILDGDRTILGRAITLAESSLQRHSEFSEKIIEQCISHSGNSIRIGITGIPGVGKSTFIESFGKYLTSVGRKVAVLAVDPSSEISHGSILGDKTRMETLSNDPSAFIRPSPSAGTLGGVARKTRECIILCEAAGFDTIIVETVGVGQSETAVNMTVDFFLLLILAGAGDELQGIKRGITEIADAIIINKADGDNITKAELAKTEFQNALHLFSPSESKWDPPVETCSSLSNSGMEKIWNIVLDYERFTKANKYFNSKRHEQAKLLMHEVIDESLRNKFYKTAVVKNLKSSLEKDMHSHKISSYAAAQKLLNAYFKSLKK